MNSADKYREMAALVIDIHTARGPCLFSPTAIEDIAGAAIAAEIDAVCEQHLREIVLDALEEAVKAAEIFCPHEGIDRRAEFGMSV